MLLIGFFLWEGWLGRRPNGQPLVDLSLFRSAPYTWGILLLTILTLAMAGVLFTLPQFFQAVLGVNAMGSGLRLLPFIAGVVVGAVSADRLAHAIGTKLTVALGFVLVVAGMFLGTQTGVASGNVFIAAWLAVVGLGMGITFVTAASAALSQLSADRSGVGSAVMQALQKIGGPFGTAILGSVLSTIYLSHLHLAGLPDVAASTVRESIFGGIAVATELHSPVLLGMVRSAFVQGMDVAIAVGACIAVIGLVLTVLFLPAGRVSSSQAVSVDAAPGAVSVPPADTPIKA